VLRALAAAVVAAVALTAAAGAATPNAMLAARLKANMQAFYTKAAPGLKITTVSCRIAANRASARCAAHFTVTAKQAIGVFQVAVAINTATGGVQTKTLSATCKDAKTGAKLTC
jgi:hypothetical protein